MTADQQMYVYDTARQWVERYGYGGMTEDDQHGFAVYAMRHLTEWPEDDYARVYRAYRETV